MNCTYNLPILGTPQRMLDRAVTDGTLQRLGTAPPGCSGTAYRLRDPRSLSVIDDFGAELGSFFLSVNVFRLPSSAYRAVILGSPRFRQHAVDGLARELLNPGVAARSWWKRLVSAALHGPSPAETVDVRQPLLQRATWCPEDTVLTATAVHTWTLTLAFDVETRWPAVMPRDTGLGIDVGIQPLAACAGHDHVSIYAGPVFLSPARADLSRLPDERSHHVARRLHHLLTYTAARQVWETLMAEQLPRASTLYLERLTPSEMSARFQRASSELGIADALYSWLPQVCHEAGIPVVRVNPAYTSSRCADCHRAGHRPAHGATFHCPVHGGVDAHRNAARVIRQLGLAGSIAEARRAAPWVRTGS